MSELKFGSFQPTSVSVDTARSSLAAHTVRSTRRKLLSLGKAPKVAHGSGNKGLHIKQLMTDSVLPAVSLFAYLATAHTEAESQLVVQPGRVVQMEVAGDAVQQSKGPEVLLIGDTGLSGLAIDDGHKDYAAQQVIVAPVEVVSFDTPNELEDKVVQVCSDEAVVHDTQMVRAGFASQVLDKIAERSKIEGLVPAATMVPMTTRSASV
ncbi:hypothetical protein ZWY2020_036900 [Hordeum vulgare]|nr:hypothetical protein ZWY2020_036900 [Hordeum vulgare]